MNLKTMARLAKGGLTEDEVFEMLSGFGVTATREPIAADPQKIAAALEPVIIQALEQGASFQILAASRSEDGPKLMAFVMLPKNS